MKRLIKNQAGQAIVELAFVLIVFLFIIFGITEFSRALYTYNTIIQSTRSAARWGVVNISGNSDAANLDRAKNIVVYGDPEISSGAPLLVGLTKDAVNVSVQTIDTDAGGTPTSQKVSVSVSGYQFQFIVPLAPDITIPAFETSLYTESMGFAG